MATFRIRAVLNPAGVVAGSKAASASLIGLQRQVNVLGATFLRVFGVVGLGIGVKTSIDLIADFQQSVATAAAISTRNLKNITINMAALSEESRRLGATTRFTAKEAADGMLFLARAGFEVNEVLTLTNKTLLLAQAGNLGVGRAADIVTNVMAGFSVGVDQAARFVDVLAKAANTTNTTIQQLGDALKFVGPVAAAVGVEVEEAAAAIGALSNAGLQATLAGTGLRRILSELEAPSSKARKFLDKLGLSENDVAISTNGLVPVIEKLIKAGFDVGDALEFFGDRGGPAFQVIKAAVEQGFIQRMTSTFLNAKGTARDLAKVMDETLKGALFALKSAFEAVILAAGELGTAGGLEDFIRGVTKQLRNLAKNIEVVTKVLQALAAVIITVLVGKALVFLETALIRIKKAAIAARFALLGPLGLAIVAVIGLMVAFSDKIALTSDGFVTLEAFGVAAFKGVGDAVTDVFETLNFGLNEALNKGGGDVNQFGVIIITIIRTIATFLDVVIGLLILVPIAISVTWEKGFKIVKDVFKRFANGIVTDSENVANKIIEFLNIVPGVDIAPIEPFKLFKVSDNPADVKGFFSDLNDVLQGGLDDIFDAAGGLKPGPLAAAIDKFLDDAIKIGAAQARERFLQALRDSFKVKIIPGNKQKILFENLLGRLDAELALLKLSNAERVIAINLKQQEAAIEGGFIKNQAAIVKARLQDIEAQKRQNSLVDEITGRQSELIQKQEDLLTAYNDSRISLDQYLIALENVKLETLEFAQDIESGELRALIKIKQEIRDIASLTENTLVNAFKSVEDAIVSFVSTGEANIHQLAQTIFAETTRILIRLLLVRALGGFKLAGAGGFDVLGDFGNIPVAQQGASFKVGGAGGPDSQLVAFRATPGEQVNVSRPGQSPQTSQAPAPIVNVTNINVLDPEEALSAIDTPKGEKIFMNFIQRNPESIKSFLGG